MRALDPDFYAATLFAPAKAQPDLWALYAFVAEMAQIPWRVSEAALGEIRFQFWEEALSGAGSHARVAASDSQAPSGGALGSGTLGPLALALEQMLGRNPLPRAPLLALIEAHRATLYAAPFADWSAIETYIAHTCAVPMRLASLILAQGSDPGEGSAIGHAGAAYGLARLVQAAPLWAARGHSIVPESVLAATGLVPADFIAQHAQGARMAPGEPPPAKQASAALGAVIARAEEYAAAYAASRRALPVAVRQAALPAALVPNMLARAAKADFGGMSPLRRFGLYGWACL